MKTATFAGGKSRFQERMAVLVGILLVSALSACQVKPETTVPGVYAADEEGGWVRVSSVVTPAEAAAAAPDANYGRVGTIDPAAMVAAHNLWRAKVGVSGLRWSDKLASVAQGWADQLKNEGCAMYHSGNGYGENIYKASALMWSDGRRELQKKTPQQVTDSWGSEIKFYNYADNSCSGVCGHYTQLVWKTTREVGCAMSVCGDNSQIWVCSYYPAGNFVAQKPY